MSREYYGTPFTETATHATAAVASHAGETGKIHYVTDIAASTDKAGAIILVKQGTTVIFQLQIATTAAGINAFSHTFKVPLTGVSGGLVSVEVDGTSACKANLAGYTI